MGMGVALMLDQSQLADPRIGLAQAHADFFVSRTSRSRARLSSLASVGNITAFGCTVVSITTRARSDGFIASVRVATARLSCSSALSLSSPHPLAPTRQRRTVEHQRMLEKFLAAEVLEVRVPRAGFENLHRAISGASA